MQLLLAIGLARMMQRVNFDQVIAGVSRFCGVFHVRTLFLMYQTKFLSHGFFLSDRCFLIRFYFLHMCSSTQLLLGWLTFCHVKLITVIPRVNQRDSLSLPFPTKWVLLGWDDSGERRIWLPFCRRVQAQELSSRRRTSSVPWTCSEGRESGDAFLSRISPKPTCRFGKYKL